MSLTFIQNLIMINTKQYVRNEINIVIKKKFIFHQLSKAWSWNKDWSSFVMRYNYIIIIITVGMQTKLHIPPPPQEEHW